VSDADDLLRQMLREAEQCHDISVAQADLAERYIARMPTVRLTRRRRIRRWATRETPQPNWFVALHYFMTVALLINLAAHWLA